MTGYDAGYIYKCKMGKLNEDGAIDESEVGFALTASDWPRLLIGWLSHWLIFSQLIHLNLWTRSQFLPGLKLIKEFMLVIKMEKA